MSTSTKSMNKNTSTSNSRSGKKPSKKVEAPVDAVAQHETVVSTPIEVVESTVDVATDITPPKTEEVAVAPTSESSETPVVEPKPVVNIWELRKQARAAEEALKKANEAIEKIATETDTEKKPASKPKAKPQPTAPVETAAESDGFTKVEYKKKPFGKSAPKHTKPASSDAKPASSDSKPAYKPKPASDAKPADSESKPKYSKPAYKPKQPTDEQVAYRERKNKALIQAQDQLIAECVAQLHPKARDDINNSMPYIINYRRTLVVKFDSDSVVADVDGEKFEFSRTRFFENRIFQDKVREKYETLIPMAWIRFFPGRDENSYCMGVMRRRAEADA